MGLGSAKGATRQRDASGILARGRREDARRPSSPIAGGFPECGLPIRINQSALLEGNATEGGKKPSG